MTSFLCFVSDSTRTDSENTDHLSLLNPLPSSLWAKSPTDIGKIHSAPPIKIQIDLLKPLPSINQYPMSKEALQGIKLIIKYYKAQDLIIPYSSSCNILNLLVNKPNSQEWRFVQDLQAMNNIVIPGHTVVPNPHMLLTFIPTRSHFFTVIDLCSAFFSILVDEDIIQYIFTFNNSPGQ